MTPSTEPTVDAGVVEACREILARGRRVVVLTGAGMSAESGVPTFRGEDGLWRRYRAEDLATPQAFARDPRLVWEWYGWRRERIGACDPHPGHLALASWLLHRPDGHLITQNVDGLHHLAAREVGAALDRDPGPALPLEIHGSIFRMRCTSCGDRKEDREPVDAHALDTLPACGGCGGLLRPDVIWFGEALDEGVLGRSVELVSGADVCLVVGTSGLVHPAAGLPGITRQQGGIVVEVNPEETPLTPLARLSIRGAAGAVLPQILSERREIREIST